MWNLKTLKVARNINKNQFMSKTRPTYYKNYAEFFVVLNFHFITIVMLFHNI